MKTLTRSNLIALVSSLGIAGSLLVGAEVAAQSQPQGRRKPPPEAYAGCTNKSAADVCSVSFHNHTISGTCVADDSSALFCKPDHMPPPPGGNGNGSGNPPSGNPPDGPPPDGEPPPQK